MKGNMKLVGIGLLAAIVVPYVGCGKKKSSSKNDSGPTLAVSGQLAIQSSLELASSMPTHVYAIPAKVIENIYSFDKSMMQIFDVGSDGRFTASVRSDYGDTLLVAIDKNASSKIDGIRGVLSLKDDSGSLLKIPAKEGTAPVDMGTMTSDSSGKEFTSNKRTDDVTSSFSLDLSKMKEIAKTDDSARGLINVVANIQDNGDFFFAKPYMVFKSNIQVVKNTASRATDLRYNGYGLYFIAKWNGLTTESLCNGGSATNKLELTPPAGNKPRMCQDGNSNSCADYSTLTNLNTGAIKTEGSNRSACGSESTNGLPADGQFYTYKETRPDGSVGPVGFNWGGGGYEGTLPDGVWTLKMNGAEVGKYNLAAANPLNAGGKATVYVPSVKANVNGSNKITTVEVQWYLWNSATSTYELVTSLDTFQRNVNDVGMEVADYSGGCAEKSTFGQMTTSGNTMSRDVSSYNAGFPASTYNGTSSSCDAESIAVTYTMNGVVYRFDYRPFYSAN